MKNTTRIISRRDKAAARRGDKKAARRVAATVKREGVANV